MLCVSEKAITPMRKILKILGYTLLTIVVLLVILVAVYFPVVKKLYFGHEIIRPDSALTIYLGGGGNSVVFNADSAVLVIDTKYGKAAARLHSEVVALAGTKPVIVINTHSDLDHTGGNALYDGATIISGKIDTNYWKTASGEAGMPTVWVTDTLDIMLGDETVSLIGMGQAHTWSDMVVVFRQRGLLVTGDLIFNRMNVFLSEDKGSHGLKSIDALKRLKLIPGVKMVVPGHNKPGGPELITLMQTYFEDMDLAARNPDKEKEIKKKYKDWVKMPGVATPATVIDYFRKHP